MRKMRPGPRGPISCPACTPKWLLVPLAAAVALAGESAALAAQPVEEIIVTGHDLGSLRLNETNGAGSRLGLSAFETPASLDLISREEIQTRGDYGTLETVTRSAGISASASPGNGGSAVSSRGFDGHDTTVNTYDGTRLYVTAGTVTFPADTWTLERVEVLRGAGSVINGVGALGATINYVPKAPVFGDSSFEALLAGGSFGMKRAAVGGGAQLSEQWAYRLDAAHHEKDGYVDRADEERNVVAGSLLFRPSMDFSMKFSVDYADIDAAPYFGTPLVDGEASDALRQNNYNFADALVEYEDIWTRVHTEWRISPSLSFRNDTFFLDAQREWQNLEEYAYDPAAGRVDRASYLGIIHDQQQLGSRGDFLLESDWGAMANRLSVGAEVNVIDLDYLNNFSTGGFDVADSVPVFGFDPGTRPPIPTILDYSTDTTQYAFFADDVLQMTEALSLVVGGRYDVIDFERFDHPIGTTPGAAFDASFHEFTWRAGVVYQPSENLSFYAQTSTAADPVASPVSLGAGDKDFDLSRGRQYEVGLKQQILGDRGEYTLAYFNIEKRDILTRRPASQITEQIGQQSSDGIEFTLRLRPLDSLGVDFNAARVDASFDEYYSDGVSLAGNTPRNVPETTANLWLNWAPADAWEIGAGLRYVGSRFGDDANTQELPAYTVLDARVGWQVTDNTALELHARNLTDEEDYVLSQYTPNQWVFAEPRAYELSVRVSL